MVPIKWHERYLISRDGCVFDTKNSRYMNQYDGTSGYKIVSLYIGNSVSRMKLVHRLVAQAYLLQPSEKHEVNHIDGNKHNNKLDNLEWVTRSNNTKHAWSIGLIKSYNKKGNNNPNSRYTKDDILRVRKLRETMTYHDIARETGISKTTVGYICRGQTWAHLNAA